MLTPASDEGKRDLDAWHAAKAEFDADSVTTSAAGIACKYLFDDEVSEEELRSIEAMFAAREGYADIKSGDGLQAAALEYFDKHGDALMEMISEEAVADSDGYEQRLGEALKESRRDFDEGRFYSSRDEMLEAVAEKRLLCSESADHFIRCRGLALIAAVFLSAATSNVMKSLSML